MKQSKYIICARLIGALIGATSVSAVAANTDSRTTPVRSETKPSVANSPAGEIKQAPQATGVTAKAKPAPSFSGDRVYLVIRKGDTLTAIGRANHVKVDDLVALNGIANENLIYAGQRLLLPGNPAAKPTVKPTSATPAAKERVSSPAPQRPAGAPLAASSSPTDATAGETYKFIFH